MEALIVLGIFVAFLFLLVKAVQGWTWRRHQFRGYLAVAKRYLGSKSSERVISFGPLGNPSLMFPYREFRCTLKSRRSPVLETRMITLLKVQMSPNDVPDFELTTCEFQQRQYLRNDQKRVTLDNPERQALFNVAAKDPVMVGKLLNLSSIAWQVEQLRRHHSCGELYILSRRGNLEIAKSGVIVEPQALEDFVRYALELVDLILLSQAQGIDFVDEGVASVVDNVKCPICSGEIETEMVVCTRCKTPHCRDCWQYNGQCATFACSETRYLDVGSVSQRTG